MAIAVDASSSFTDGGATQDPYTSGSFTPPNGAQIFVCASSFATSGDDNSEIVVTGTVLIWTRVANAFLDQLNFGGSCAPPPIAFYTATGTGVSITVTQECVDGLGFSHVQGIWVLTGAHATTPVIDADTFTGLGAASITMTATAAGQYALFGMCDWGNSLNTPVEADANMTTRYANASADIQASFCGDLVSTGAGAITIGTNVLGLPQGTNAVAVLIQAAAAGTNANAEAATLTMIANAAAASVAANAGPATLTIAANGPSENVAPSAGLASATMTAEIPAASVGVSPAPALLAVTAATAAASAGASAETAAITFAAPTAAAAIAPAAGAAALAVTAQDAVIPVTAQAQVATFTVGAPDSHANIAAAGLGLASIGFTAFNPQAGNITSMSTDFSPCDWDPIQCCVWPTGSEAVTGYARQAATEVLWQESGQRYGLCEITIRPCRRQCDGGGWPFMDRWYEWAGGMWPRPLLFNGLWFNIACGGCPGSCSCTVLEEVLLPGVVSSISQVKVDGVILPSTAYRLDNNQLLVRVDGGSWPYCQDMAAADTQPDTFSVTFTFGEVPPVIGRQAVGQLMCALARECMGEDCRLPANVTSLVRQGVAIELDADFLKRFNFVSLFLRYANPAGLQAAPGIYDPDAQSFRRAGA